ncbi:FerIin domain,C2 domain [Cinara cedri]|uniref:FerIin domain,C2 domain n=1 Tax=Cinara cedri TaxID=506608 RepID=A0A5E4N1T3_9HEMI|nr:FerIin domain,C2 domain [Cinara cedri]
MLHRVEDVTALAGGFSTVLCPERSSRWTECSPNPVSLSSVSSKLLRTGPLVEEADSVALETWKRLDHKNTLLLDGMQADRIDEFVSTRKIVLDGSDVHEDEFIVDYIIVMDNLDYLGEIEMQVEKIKSQIMINIIEGRHYSKSNLDTYVVVEIPSYFTGKTIVRKTSTSPSYFKTFIIDLPTLLLNDLLNLRIIITVYESHKTQSLWSKTILGSTVIEINTIWSEQNKLFHNKWLTLINREKDDFGIKGYLRCDMIIFYESKSIHNLSIPRPLKSTNTNIEIDKSNLLIPSGFKMTPTHLARYSLNLYKSEIMHHSFNGSNNLLIGFGESLESNIMLKIRGPEINWNTEHSTINLYPPLCPTITIKFTFSGKIIARRTLSIHDFSREDDLPNFGPTFLHFMSLETQKYFGRLLISIKTELLQPEIENIKSYQIEHIESISDKKLFNQFCFEELKRTASLIYSESEILTLMNKIRDMFKELSVLHKNMRVTGVTINQSQNLSSGPNIDAMGACKLGFITTC